MDRHTRSNCGWTNCKLEFPTKNTSVFLLWKFTISNSRLQFVHSPFYPCIEWMAADTKVFCHQVVPGEIKYCRVVWPSKSISIAITVTVIVTTAIASNHSQQIRIGWFSTFILATTNTKKNCQKKFNSFIYLFSSSFHWLRWCDVSFLLCRICCCCCWWCLWLSFTFRFLCIDSIVVLCCVCVWMFVDVHGNQWIFCHLFAIV